jgi:protoporphyrinogen oxidase
MVKSPEETIWIGLEYFCREGDDFWRKDDGQLADYAMKELMAMGVIDSQEKRLDFHCERVKKAYPAYFDTYKDIDKLIEWLDKLPNLYCVGRNGQHRYNNMDHSMATSFEAVKNILGGIGDKSNVWNVNTEKEYHEEKKSENK